MWYNSDVLRYMPKAEFVKARKLKSPVGSS